MEKSHHDAVSPERIRWDHDEETGRPTRPPLRRGASVDTMSIRPVPSRNNSMDAAAALPIQYRTM